MTLKTPLTFLASTFALSACLPVEDVLSERNAMSVLIASRQANNVSEQVQAAEDAARILERFQTRSNSGATFSCDVSGSMTYEALSENTFSLDFIDCTNNKGRLDGQVTGTVELDLAEETVAFSYQATDLESENNAGNIVVFDEINLTTEFGWSTGVSYFNFEHSGTYDFDTNRYRGELVASTIEVNHHPLSDLNQCTGEVTYTDTNGNVLTVNRNGNGIDIYFNDAKIQSYSCLWIPTS